jgi:cell division protein FtsZ
MDFDYEKEGNNDFEDSLDNNSNNNNNHNHSNNNNQNRHNNNHHNHNQNNHNNNSQHNNHNQQNNNQGNNNQNSQTQESKPLLREPSRPVQLPKSAQTHTIKALSTANPDLSEIDQELEAILQKQSTKVKVFGIGGGGNNTISRMREIGIKGGQMIAVNTDAQDLLYANADYKILVGKDLTQGLGAGSNPRVGEEAAHESEQEIKKALQGSDMMFVTCGLGGGTGTGAAPVVASLAKKQGALVVGIVTLPFTIEGKKRIENAMYGLEKMESVVDTLIVIPNDKLLELAPELPLHTAFKVADEILTNAVKGTTELVTKSGLVNLDFADVKAVMSNGGVSLIGMGESDSQQRALDAVEKAVNNPLLDVDISNASGALVNIIGGPDMSLDEAKTIIAAIGDRLGEEAKMIWGAQISEDMDKALRVMLIVTGVKSPQIMGSTSTIEERHRGEMSEELGIEFLE